MVLSVGKMEYIQRKVRFSQERESVVTLGKFDGVHIGHQKLIRAMEQAKDGRESIVFTFDVPPVPDGMLGERTNVRESLLTTNQERAELIDNLGVDKLIECPFIPEISGMEPEAFLREVLAEQLKAKKIFVGPDFRFGYQRRGDVELLKACQKTYGYRLTVVEKACCHGEEVSSTGIRDRIRKGMLQEANEMLGRALFYSGEVLYGNQLGRTIGFPTANLLVQPEKTVPPFGVYAATFYVENQRLNGIANIGRKPTIQAENGGENPVGIETHLFDFQENIYGKEAKVAFHKFIRPETKFESIEAMQEEIERNEEQVRGYFG